MNIYVSDSARLVLDKLSGAGFSAFIVGGSVRDALLGKKPSDFDITTSATPDEIKAVFDRTFDTGIAHGTVTVVIGDEPIEVTTFRVDGEYLDSRHPEAVSFTSDISLDLARRDFTVNAMAYNDEVGLVDLFGGADDLTAGIIRAVGEPRVRFSEDALRILRALRFSSTLNFSIEEQTQRWAKNLADNLSQVSGERIYAELKKLLSGSGAYRILTLYADIIRVFLPDFKPSLLPRESEFLALDTELRSAALFASLGADGIGRARARLRLDNSAKSLALGVAEARLPEIFDDKSLLLLLEAEGERIAGAALRIGEAYGRVKSGASERAAALVAEGAPFRIVDLAISGDELVPLGFSGRAIRDTLRALLLAVIRGETSNERQALLEYAKEL